MAQRLRAAVYGIMLCAGVGLEVAVVIALHSQYSLNSEYCIEVWVLSTGLLATAPAWISEDIYIRTPECKFGISGVVYHSHWYVEYIVV